MTIVERPDLDELEPSDETLRELDDVLRRSGWHTLADELENERELATPATVTTSGFVPFACPICGRTRELSARAMRAIRAGTRDGSCAPGEGCRARLSERERYRRWWLEWAGVPAGEIARAGSATAYVARHGLPHVLGSFLYEP